MIWCMYRLQSDYHSKVSSHTHHIICCHDNCLYKNSLLPTIPSRRVCHATQGAIVIQKAEGAREKHRHKFLLWPPWERQGKPVWTDLGLAGLNHFSGLWAKGEAPRCCVPDPTGHLGPGEYWLGVREVDEGGGLLGKVLSGKVFTIPWN